MPSPGIVLLHGQPDVSSSLWPLRTALRGRLDGEVHILAPDRPGYGANLLPPADFAGNARWLTDLLRRSDLGPVILVGHSWAGGVALLAASDAADTSVAGLVLLASIGPSCLLWSDKWLAMPVLGEIASFLSLRLAAPVVLREAGRKFNHLFSVDELRYSRQSALGLSAHPMWRSFLYEQRALVAQLDSLDAALSGIEVPTLVLQGTSDSVIPPVTPRLLAAGIDDSRRIALTGAGHDLHLRRAGEVAEHIATFARQTLPR